MEDKKKKKNKSNKEQRFLKSIIKNLSDKTAYFENKIGWNNFWLISDEGIEELAKNINYIKETIEKNAKTNFFEEPKNYKLGIKTAFSITQKENDITIGVAENNLERVICIFNDEEDDEIKNQIPTCDGGHIDICKEYDDTIEIIELKQWISNDNPLFALVELMKNYYLLCLAPQNNKIKEEINKKNKKINLTLLAPKSYYESYSKAQGGFNEKVLTNYFLFKKKLEELENIKIHIKYFDIDRETIYDVVKDEQEIQKQIANGVNEIKYDWKKLKGKLIEKLTPEKQINLKNWPEIKTVQDWPKN